MVSFKSVVSKLFAKGALFDQLSYYVVKKHWGHWWCFKSTYYLFFSVSLAKPKSDLKTDVFQTSFFFLLKPTIEKKDLGLKLIFIFNLKSNNWIKVVLSHPYPSGFNRPNCLLLASTQFTKVLLQTKLLSN